MAKIEMTTKNETKLKKYRKKVEEAYKYFTDNYADWHKMRDFIFRKSLTDKDIATLDMMGKPQLEFNIVEAYISRLRGEFSKQEPSIEVRSDYGTPVDPKTIEAVEGIIRHIFVNSKKDGTEYGLITDMLSGGFAVAEVGTEYAHEKSFNQIIYFKKIDDPTMCGFDPHAKTPHKGDGDYCFRLYPKTKQEMEDEYDVDTTKMKFSRNVEGFSWSYANESNDKIGLVCEFYQREHKKVKIVELTNGEVMEEDEYEKNLQQWEAARVLEVPPQVKQVRWSKNEVIKRYIFVEDQILKEEETDYKLLPYVFFPANSVRLRLSTGQTKEVTRSYAHHVQGTQRLKNYIGNALANEMENLVQHKFMIPKQGIVAESIDPLKNIQRADVIVYNAFKDDDPNTAVPPPREVQRPPIDQMIFASFQAMDATSQVILGSYDASLGINNNQLSGVAIVEGATQSNAAAMPIIIGYLQGLNRVANIMVDLIPYYYVTPRTIPVVNKQNKKDFIRVNQQGGVNLCYDYNALQVTVEPGVNFSIQKRQSLELMITAMKANEMFGRFITEECLLEFADNLELRGIDNIKVKAEQYMQKLQQAQAQQAQMQQQAMQNNPLMIRAQTEQAKVMMQAQQNQAENKLKAAELGVDMEKVQNERMKVLADMEENKRNAIVQLDKHQTEKTRAAVDMAIKAADVKHKHAKDAHDIVLKHKAHALKASTATKKGKTK